MIDINIFEALSLRSEFEELVLNMKVPGEYKYGTFEGLKWFIENGYERNKKFNGVERALEIANMIVNNRK